MLSGCRRPAGVAVIAYLVAMYLAVAAFLMVEWPLSIYFLEEP